MRFLKNKFNNISKPIYILPLIFAFISVFMMLSTSYNNGLVVSKTFIVQTVSYLLGIVAIFVIMEVSYSAFESWNKYLYIFSVLFLLTPLIPGLGVEQFGAKSWINLGITTFQPSEVVKLTFIFIMANYFNRKETKLNDFGDFVKAFLYAAPLILIVLKEDFGSAAVFAGIFISMCIFAGLPMKLFGRIVLGVIIVLPFFFKRLKPYQKDRLLGFLYPEDLTIQANYQVFQSKIAIGSGGIFGKGPFNGTQNALEFLPVKNSDFIFAVICEEFGLVGGGLLIILFIWFLYALLKEAFTIKDRYGSLIIIGIMGMFAFQIFENIAMTMGLMPVTGITLPFISYGGSGVLSNMIAVGIVLSICQSNRNLGFLK